MLLKKLYKILVIVLTIYLLHFDNLEYEIKMEDIDNIIINKIGNKKYDGYIYIPKFDYKCLIRSGNDNEVLSSNDVLLFDNGSKIDDEFGNTVLAGHNNKMVFSILYKLSKDDDIILNTFDNNYRFIIYDIKVVNIKDTYVLDNVYDKKMVTLITCTKDNQKRLIIHGEIDSHNFT